MESCRQAFRLVPSAQVCVAESEAEDYAQFAKALRLHPDSVTGIGPVRRWILDNYRNECVVTFDDDITHVLCLVGRRARKITDPEAIYQIIQNASVIARQIGVSLFSFAITGNILNFSPDDPFGLTHAHGPCLGFVGRKILPDMRLYHSTDADLTVEALFKDRIVWQDTRFMFQHSFMSNRGGNRHMITQETWASDMKLLKRKWGKYIKESVSSGVTRVVVDNITRRQRMSL